MRQNNARQGVMCTLQLMNVDDVPKTTQIHPHSPRTLASTHLDIGGPLLSFSHSLFSPRPLPLPFPFSTPLTGSPLIQLGGLGERCKLPSRSGQSPATKRILVHLEVKTKRFRGQITCIFNRRNLKVLL